MSDPTPRPWALLARHLGVGDPDALGALLADCEAAAASAPPRVAAALRGLRGLIDALEVPSGTAPGDDPELRDLASMRFALDQHAIVSVTDAQGRILHVNDRFCELTGYAREELLGRTHAAIAAGTHPPEHYRDMWTTIASGRVWRGEFCNRAKSGTLHWVDASIVPVPGPDGRPERYIAIRTDVTERRRAEAALQEQLRFGTELLDAIPVAIYFKDAQGRFLGMNRALEWLFDVDRRTAVGRTSDEIFPGGYADVHVERDRELLARPSRQAYEMEMPLPDGTPRTLYYSKASMTDARGAVTGVIGVIFDTTERKSMERRLSEAKESAEAASRAKSEFLANMSHEIRTPMNGIIGMTELLLDTPLSDHQRDYLTTVRQSADAMLEIINDLLDLSKVEAGRMDLESIRFGPHALLEQLCRPIALSAERKGLAMSLEIAPDVPRAVRGDPGRLRQVLVNLLGNAVKFTERGSVTLRVATLAPAAAEPAAGEPATVGTAAAPAVAADRADVPDADADDEVRLRFDVIDTGVGIAPEKHALVFDAFAQADTSTSRRFGGTGLGLAITRRLVEAMGGTVRLDSAPGRGSTFSFDVRLAACAPGIDDDGSADGAAGPDAHGSAAHAVPEAATAVRTYAQAACPGPDHRTTPAAAGEPATTAAAATLATAAAATPPGAASSVSPRPLRVLLAEDNPVNQKLAQLMLGKLGHSVEVAGDGRRAYEMAAGGGFDLVLMDMQMPETDGLEATRMIRAAGLSVPIVAMTANAMEADRARCREAGMDGFLAKPVRAPELAAAIAAATGALQPETR